MALDDINDLLVNKGGGEILEFFAGGNLIRGDVVRLSTTADDTVVLADSLGGAAIGIVVDQKFFEDLSLNAHNEARVKILVGAGVYTFAKVDVAVVTTGAPLTAGAAGDYDAAGANAVLAYTASTTRVNTNYVLILKVA